MISTASRQLAAGWTLTSMTPGSGVTLMTLDARIERRRIALDLHRQTALGGGRLDRRDQFEIILELLDRRHEDAEHAVARLDDSAVRTAPSPAICSTMRLRAAASMAAAHA